MSIEVCYLVGMPDGKEEREKEEIANPYFFSFLMDIDLPSPNCFKHLLLYVCFVIVIYSTCPSGFLVYKFNLI